MPGARCDAWLPGAWYLPGARGGAGGPPLAPPGIRGNASDRFLRPSFCLPPLAPLLPVARQGLIER